MEEQIVQKKKGGKKSFVGIVTSDKMDKTIVVSIDTKKMDRLYKKYVTRTKKCKAHDETNDAHIGDTVRIVECSPISKDKHWRLDKIIERAR
ncbi:MAG: 30S ribosomal protein S17 [Treponema sp.]|nr:30S ribosomal protein S17 [Treponema sp.]MBR6080663.1 30S ribosomal protein S17 [Treponema sp.]MBR6192607.1 30S ribosomal protein S17 [Treponema sp.]